MEIVHYAPNVELEEDLWLELGKRYMVHSVSYSPLAGVLFELVGFEIKGLQHFHRRPANHFRALNGKRAGIVKAIPGTEAFKKHEDRLLFLSGLVHFEGADLVRRREVKSTVEHLKGMPYDQFEHV